MKPLSMTLPAMAGMASEAMAAISRKTERQAERATDSAGRTAAAAAAAAATWRSGLVAASPLRAQPDRSIAVALDDAWRLVLKVRPI